MALVITSKLWGTRVVKNGLFAMFAIVALSGGPLTKALPVQAPSSQNQLHSINDTFMKTPQALLLTKNQAKKAAQTAVGKSGQSSAAVIQKGDCASAAPLHEGLTQSSLPQLAKLAQYEQVCKSGIIDRASFFTTLPTSSSDATASADDVAGILKEYASQGIRPLVFLEPTNDAGLVDLAALQRGAYDNALQTYFSHLKAAGISDAMMGVWVPLPEGNLPVWSSVSPGDFSGSVTKIATFQKQTFPASKTSIMLDTRTYPTAGVWSGGRVVSLLPYVQPIPRGLIDSIGLQGFPWEPAANLNQANNGTPIDYLRVDLLIEAARSAGVQDVWVNSGTFSVAYASQAGQVTISPAQRATLLNGVIAQLKTVQSAGLSVSMHLFAQDKSRTDEAINWSYWSDNQAATSDSTIVFKNFVHDLQAAHVPLWLFDARE